jgi:hypothetical protein
MGCFGLVIYDIDGQAESGTPEKGSKRDIITA